MILRIAEAKAYSLLVHGLEVKNADIYNRIWPNRKWTTARQNWINLVTGLTKNPRQEWIDIIQEETKAPRSLIIGEQKVKSMNFEWRDVNHD